METKRDLCREMIRTAGVLLILLGLSLCFGITAHACENEQCVNYQCSSENLLMTDCMECLYSEWDEDLKEYTMALCEEYDISYAMVNAVIWNESRYQAEVIGHNQNGTRDWGLMQLNDVNLSFLSQKMGLEKMEDLLNPKVCIKAGVVLLDYCKNWGTTDEEILMCYQMGQGAFSRHMKNGGGVTEQVTQMLARGTELVEKICVEEVKQVSCGSEMVDSEEAVSVKSIENPNENMTLDLVDISRPVNPTQTEEKGMFFFVAPKKRGSGIVLQLVRK